MGIRDWLRRQIGEVPEPLAVCEFRCDRTTCRHGDWERCEHRLRGGLPADLPRDPDAGAEGAGGA